jgi:hypothetical protein
MAINSTSSSSEPVLVNGGETEIKTEAVTNGTDATDTTEKATEKKPDVPVGSISTIKNIYKSPKDGDGNWTWVDKYPEDVEEAAENEETEKFAVIVRNIKSQDSRKKLEADSIIVQSPWLKTALGEILADYPGVACELRRLVFDAPFQPFVHRWPEFTKYMARKGLDPKTAEHLAMLYDILKYEIGDSIKAYEDYVLNGVIDFDHLWMIFQPSSVILSAHKGPLSAFELTESEYMATQCGKFLRLRCDCVDYSGKTFGRYSERIDIPEFIGTKKITGLAAFPWAFHENKDAVKNSLVIRGRIFEALAGHHYRE